MEGKHHKKSRNQHIVKYRKRSMAAKDWNPELKSDEPDTKVSPVPPSY